IGVRVLVNCAWGSACDRRLESDGASAAAVRAVAFASAAGVRGPKPLAPIQATRGTYRAQAQRDPFAVSLDAKVALCLRAADALAGPKIVLRRAMVRALREHKVLVVSGG